MLRVEANYNSGVLATRGGGKGVFAFLNGLSSYCSEVLSPDLACMDTWYKQLEVLAQQSLCTICQPLIQSMWGDDGDHTDYTEAEYEWYIKRNASQGHAPTEAEFKALLQESKKHWVELKDVMESVKFLIDLFKQHKIDSLDGFYRPEDTIPDFESLYETLDIFDKFGYDEVRLNFM